MVEGSMLSRNSRSIADESCGCWWHPPLLCPVPVSTGWHIYMVEGLALHCHVPDRGDLQYPLSLADKPGIAHGAESFPPGDAAMGHGPSRR